MRLEMLVGIGWLGFALVGCNAGDGASSPITDDGAEVTAAAPAPPPACAAGCASEVTASHDDGVKNGDETDVDCGGSAKACADGRACLVDHDCESAACGAGVCQAPTATDGRKNGDETDVDCGGSTTQAPKCAAGKSCREHADCQSNGCREGVCAEGRSCRRKAGGATCGPGEVGDPGAAHEDCCVALTVPRPAAEGGPFKLEKYLITAGRMRAFLEAVGYDVRGYIQAHRPAWWTGSGTAGWDDMLPRNFDEFLNGVVNGGSGCYVGATANSRGAPAYWASTDDLARAVGGGPRAYTRDELDTKVMNCFRAPLFHALCAFDGGRLPSRKEWMAARTVDGVVRPYPWGSNGSAADRRARGSYDFNYAWPREPAAGDNDLGGYLPAPGRFPLGAGPYGHADLLGSVENMGSQPASGGGVTGDGWFQFSFQEAEQSGAPYGTQVTSFGSGAYRSHWAVGARCVRLP
jgi:formylglycine-generating enzyme required for sulfatase activity